MDNNNKSGQYAITTVLPQRSQYFDRVNEMLEQDDSLSCCMITVDIKNFHFYNRWYGRNRGDEMLERIGQFFKGLTEDYDVVTGYMGGDNFSAFFEYNGWIINTIIDNVQDIVKEYAPVDPTILPVFGAYRILASDILEKVTAADIYDYTAHALRQTTDEAVVWFDSSTIKKREEELRMLPEVLAAMDRDEFTFYLQPKCHLKTGKIIGAEALVRWHSPEKGMISPGIFVPLLEDHGLIPRLDLIVWEKVCAQIREWQKQGLRVLPISVNVSRVDIMQLDVPMTFEYLVQKYELEPSNIEIEITESAYTDDDSNVIETVNLLHKAGFKVLIDDFGSGYSSLNLLKDIQADVLKLDMKFLGSSDDNEEKSFSIIESILEMSRQLGIPAIIEGVESAKQISVLESLGCEFAQGYFYYKPMPFLDFERLLSNTDILGVKRNYSKIVDKSYLQQLSEYFVKVATVNVDNGSYTFLTTDDMHRRINIPEAETIKEYALRFIDKGLIHPEDSHGYIKLFDMEYLRRKIESGRKRFLYSLRYIEDGKYFWVVFEITVPEDFSFDKNPIVLFTWKRAVGRISRTEDLIYLMEMTCHKMVKCNLDTTNIDIVWMYDDEKKESSGFSENLQTWFDEFANKGYIHKDDKEKFVEFAKVSKIKKHFARSDKPMLLKYRRLVNGRYTPVELVACKSKEYTKANPIILLYVKK